MDEKTRLIRAGHAPANPPRTVGPAVQRGSTVLMADARALYGEPLSYGRSGLTTQLTLIDALCELEGASAVQLYPSGLAAIAGAMLAVLKAGDEVLVNDGVYKPSRRFCENVLRRFGVKVRFYAPSTSAADLIAMAGPETRLIMLESPASLTFEIQDVSAITSGARQRGILTLMDNTWGAGLLFKPLSHGVDLSIQALTKYVVGHSDVFMGSVATLNPDLAALLEEGGHNLGWAVSPDDAYQVLRGLRTLSLRLQQHGQNGLAVARWLQGRSEIAHLLHPALPGCPGHDTWKRDYSGACGLFGFVLKPGTMAATYAFLDALQLFGLGFSWGGFESLAIHCDPQLKARMFPPDYTGALIRLHVGLEEPADLIADLYQALTVWTATS